MKVVLGIEYNGEQYQGWQMQAHTNNTIEYALSQAVSFVANHKVKLYCAGRTDKGVHATGQVVHFDTISKRSHYAWLMGINSKLPNNIVVNWVCFADNTFHARFSAKFRQYRYFINNASNPSAILAGMVTNYKYPLDAYKMNQVAKCLLGEHDFSSFRAANCQSNTPFRFIDYINIFRNGDYIIIDIRANAFLYHMVRNIVGSLIEVGQGRRSLDWFIEVFNAKKRSKAAATAPADGLYLVEVSYDYSYNIPSVDLPLLIGG